MFYESAITNTSLLHNNKIKAWFIYYVNSLALLFQDKSNFIGYIVSYFKS